MIVDYHTHSALCRHASGDVEEYILRALELGFDEIGCSDHAPLPGNYDDIHRMTIEEYYAQYAPRVSELISKYDKRIRVRRGMEVDYLAWADEWNTGFIAENDFDFVIGSVHFVGKRGEEKPLFGKEYEPSEIESLYEGYFLEIARSARSGLFDVIGHCDIVKKFGAFVSPHVQELTWQALNEIKRADLCIEINTSGLRRDEREVYPGETILAMVRDLKIPLTLGSDAHKPEQVGFQFERGLELIERFGLGKISVFDRRQRSEASVTKLQRAAG